MQYNLTIRDEAPPAEIKNALEKFAATYPRLGPPNVEGEWILWSDTGWNCGHLTRVRQDVPCAPVGADDECVSCVL